MEISYRFSAIQITAVTSRSARESVESIYLKASSREFLSVPMKDTLDLIMLGNPAYALNDKNHFSEFETNLQKLGSRLSRLKLKNSDF